MTDADQAARLERLAARRAPTAPDSSGAAALRRRPAEASRWLVAAGSAAAGFGLVAALAVANQPDAAAATPQPTPAPAPQAVAPAQPIIVINTGTPLSAQDAAVITAQNGLPSEPAQAPVGQEVRAPVTESRGS